MATKKQGGTSKNLRDSQPKYLGVKRGDGASVGASEVIVRQRGTKIEAGKNIRIGKDHTLYAAKAGVVSFSEKRKVRFDGSTTRKKVANIV